MSKLTYKTKFFSIVIFLIFVVIFIVFEVLNTFSKTNVGDISKNNFEIEAFEKNELIYNFFKPYYQTIKSVSNDKNFKEYLDNKLDQKYIENYFKSVRDSLPYLSQIRYLNNYGQEIIREDKDISNQKEKNIALQYKGNSDYFKKFILLKANEISMSNINLNKEFGVITIPKEITVRLGTPLYDSKKNKKGILVFNISLNTLFKLLSKSALYHISLIDIEGNYLLHNNSRYGILADNNFNIKDEYSDYSNNILKNNEYFGADLYSKKLNSFKNNQVIKIILKSKFQKELNETQKVEKYFIFSLFIFIIVVLAFTRYFSSLLDILSEKLLQASLINKNTKLPNKLALLEDLSNNQFSNSIIILVSINNIIKIQNSYGHKISDLLVFELAKYISNYKNNMIEKVYMNSHDIFCLKYKASNEDNLKKFLKRFTSEIENRIFKLKRSELEFTVDITIGVSNPSSLNNSISELNEAENALYYALSNHIDIEIFNINHQDNILLNKESLILSRKIKKAIDNDGITLDFQAILNNKTQKIEKYESLIRLSLDDELIYPDKFLPVAKEINRYNELSKKVVEKSFVFFMDKDFEFSINLSIQDILNEDFKIYLINMIQNYNIGHRLVLEIVEQEGINNYEEFYNFIKIVKDLNCKIAIDDFGSGYSNFEYIIQMSEYIDYLKIDGSLIKNIDINTKSQLLVESLVSLCKKLEIKTIAEYVENEKIFSYLKSIDVDFSQGYYIGKPNKNL